ncbi:MAG: phosphoribosylglycinamide formyltransferase [Planctomycetes bacterium]|nr:phosphoribosylglycinamide formyltransferase [Planctomycetota bacterium]
MTKGCVVLASGSGRSVENLAGWIERGELDAEIRHVIASKEGLGVLERATRLKLPTTVIGRGTHPDSKIRNKALIECIDALNPDLIVMAGWLLLLPIPAHWVGKVINIHPALIPSYSGKGYWGHHVHEAVVHDGQSLSGCTIHFASNEYDLGPIILQESVPCFANDTADSLAARVFEVEKKVLPEAIDHLLSGRVCQQENQAVWIPDAG